MKVKQKDLLWSSLPSAKDKKKIMAAQGAYMEPGPKIPGLKNTIKNLPPDYFDIFNTDPKPSKPIGTVPIPYGTPDTGKINLPEPSKTLPLTQPPKGEGRVNPADLALTGLGLFDALLPNPVDKMQVVTPQLGYNPYPYGTGSQALMDNGGYILGEDENNSPSAKSGIHIKPSKRGTLHDALGISRDKKIPASKLADKPGDSPALKKKKNFARNARKWNHADGGLLPGSTWEGGYNTANPQSSAMPALFQGMGQFFDQIGQAKEGVMNTFTGGFPLPMKQGGIIPDNMSNFSPHHYENGGNVNGGARINMVGANYPNSDLLEQWLLYKNGGEVGPKYPNTDLLEQWIPWMTGDYENGGQIREVGPYYPNTDLLEQWIQYKNGGQIKKAALGDTIEEPDPGDPKKLRKNLLYRTKSTIYPTTIERDVAYSDKLSQLIANGIDPYISGQGKALANNLNTGFNQQFSKDLLLDVKKFQSSGTYNTMSPQERLERFYAGNFSNPEVGKFIGEARSIAGSPSSLYESSALPKGPLSEAENQKNLMKHFKITDAKKGTMSRLDGQEYFFSPDFLDKPNESKLAAFKNGGVMYDDGGQVDTMWGGNVNLASYNPYDGGTLEFNGASHDNGGIGMVYNDSPVEVEGGEFASKDVNGNLNIYGNMFLPGTKTKFKAVAKEIAAKEKRYNMLMNTGSELVNNSNKANKYEKLSFNAGKVMMEGGEIGSADIAQKKEQLSSLQRAMLDTAADYNLDPQAMSAGKIKKAKGGAVIPFLQDGGENDPTLADRNNNPGNIKWGAFAKKYGAKKGPAATDGGNFAIFPSRDKGLSAMKGLLKSKNYKDLDVDSAINRWTSGNPYRYALSDLKGKKISELNDEQFGKLVNTMVQGEGTKYGPVGSTPTPPVRSTRPPNISVPPPPYTPYTLPPVTLTPNGEPSTPATVNPPYDKLNPPPDRPDIPSDVEPLHLNQVLGEIYSAATNKVEPVPTQRYEPQLFNPYQVSFQDRLNRNQNTFAAMQRSLGASNPSALGTLAAQKYEADNAVKADEFRTNQAIANDITNKNISLINDAQLKNLQIADTQMVRQSTARSKTRQVNQMIVNSLSSKYAQNQLENRRLATYENLYDYRFKPTEDGGLRATYLGADAMFNYSGANAQQKPQDVTTKTTYDAQGNVKRYTEQDDSFLKEQQRLMDIEKKRRSIPLIEVPRLDK